ncbi:MAG: hypothetical protein LM583_08095, partial [Desulfurococcaceae archaeon]|nr:hypothetical protein [Desulfurococcaceae archaeon]
MSRRLRRAGTCLFIAMLLDVLWYIGLVLIYIYRDCVKAFSIELSLDLWIGISLYTTLRLSIGVIHGLKIYILYKIGVYEALKSLVER